MARFIPTNAATFLQFATTLTNVVNQHINEWKHIPETAFDDLLASVNEFGQQSVITTADSPRSQILRRNEAQKQCESALRYFIRFYLRNPVVTNPQLAEMGIPPIDKIRTPHVVVDEMVSFEIRRRRENELMIHFQQRGHVSKAKPTGYDGAVIIWGFS